MGPKGDLLLVVRPRWLVSALPGERTAPPPPRALVVDDSLTARAQHRAMLEAGGFAVHAVGSAVVALDRLERTRYGVVVCDVAMEGMNGHELVRRVRQREELRATPVVLVSAHDSDAERAAAESSGADAFLGKRECASGRLLEVVATAIAHRKRAP
jgi:CheY-like chemotaxis protein